MQKVKEGQIIMKNDFHASCISVRDLTSNFSEKRFTLLLPNGGGVVVVRTDSKNLYENAHHHSNTREEIIVLEGALIFASVKQKHARLQVCRPLTKSHICEKNTVHALYVAPNTVYATVRVKSSADPSCDDWHGDPDVDMFLRNLDISGLLLHKIV